MFWHAFASVMMHGVTNVYVQMITKILQLSGAVSLAVLISGCAAPKPSHEEMNKKLISTLNIYQDNRVGMFTYDQSSYSWTKQKDTVLAFSVYGNAYNLKDIKSVSFADNGRVVVDFVGVGKKDFGVSRDLGAKFN